MIPYRSLGGLKGEFYVGGVLSSSIQEPQRTMSSTPYRSMCPTMGIAVPFFMDLLNRVLLLIRSAEMRATIYTVSICLQKTVEG